MEKLFEITNNALDALQSLALLLIRLILAYGFYEPAMNKISDIHSVASWFGTLGIPLPTLNAYLAVGTELAGVVLLTLGLFTRYIGFPLMVIMLVAIGTVHLQNGFSAGSNGFEIPLYYLLMLFILVSHGGGKYSLDNLWLKRV
ncbi:MAG TPA: DoxX family protein [Arcobacter sp.]|jgi:putative oxidoreductase|nr:DoxX family protein [Arcobacter sp.]